MFWKIKMQVLLLLNFDSDIIGLQLDLFWLMILEINSCRQMGNTYF